MTAWPRRHGRTPTRSSPERSATRSLEPELAVAERALGALFTFAGILTTDGVLLTVNQPSLDIASLEPHDVVGRPFWKCFWWAYDDDVATQVQRSCERAANGEPVRYEVSVRIAGERLLPIHFQVAPLRDDVGRVTHLIASGQDRSAELEARQVERRAKHRAEALERVASGLASAATIDDIARHVVEDLADVGPGTITLTLRPDDTRRSGVVEQSEHDDPERRRPSLTVPVPGRDGTPIGELTSGAPPDGPLDRSHRQLLTTVAAQVGAALERARLHERERFARRRADSIAETLTALEGAGTVREQLDALVRSLAGSVADFAVVEMPAEDPPLLAAAHRDEELRPVVIAVRRYFRLHRRDDRSMWRVADGERHLVTEVTADMRRSWTTDERALAEFERLGVVSYLAVPLALGGGRTGSLLCALDDQTRRRFTDDDVTFLDELARRAGLIIAATHAREQELAASRRLQRALLPATAAAHPELDVHALYSPGADELDIGGDWYDTFRWDDDRYGVVVGDVVGHGIDAAASMGRLRAAAGTLIVDGPADVAAMLESIERAAVATGVRYATAFCAVVDPRCDQVSYASAGHPPALLLRAAGPAVWLDDATSPPVCELRCADRPTSTRSIGAGDTLVVYTDGLVEHRRDDLRTGLDRLSVLAEGLHRRSDVAALNHELIERCGADGGDDVVVLSLHHRPGPDRASWRIVLGVDELAQVRADLRLWLGEHGVDHERAERIVLATGEACANAIEHAFVDIGGGTVEVRATSVGRSIFVTVSDTGAWRQPAMALTDRGRGLSIMRSVAEGFERRSGPIGTSVLLRFDDPPAQV